MRNVKTIFFGQTTEEIEEQIIVCVRVIFLSEIKKRRCAKVVTKREKLFDNGRKAVFFLSLTPIFSIKSVSHNYLNSSNVFGHKH